jgi:hypothetical protein
MLIEERRQRSLVAAARLLDRVVRVAGCSVREGPNTFYPRASQNAGPEKWPSHPACAGHVRRRDWVAYDELLAPWTGAVGGPDPAGAYRRYVSAGLAEPPLRHIRWMISRPITAVSPSGQIVLSAHLAGPSRPLIDPLMGRRVRERAKSGRPR